MKAEGGSGRVASEEKVDARKEMVAAAVHGTAVRGVWRRSCTGHPAAVTIVTYKRGGGRSPRQGRDLPQHRRVQEQAAPRADFALTGRARTSSALYICGNGGGVPSEWKERRQLRGAPLRLRWDAVRVTTKQQEAGAPGHRLIQVGGRVAATRQNALGHRRHLPASAF